MNEAVALWRDLDEDRCVRSFLASLDVVLRVVFVAGFEQPDVELPSDDGTVLQGSHAHRRHVGEPLLNGRANRPRDRRPCRRALRAPQPDHLREEKRMPISGLVELCHKRGVGSFSGRLEE